MGRKFLFRMILSLLFVAMGVTASFAQTSLYVSSDYNSSTEGYGTTKFSNYAGAYAYATANAKTTATIVIEKTNTLSGNTFDNNHKNYSKLAVVIKDGATMGNALSKWDMTYPVTVEPGGTLTCARPASASVSNIHIKNKLIVGAKGATKKAVVDFLSDSYQDCDISIRYNGSIEVYNADFYVQDLDAQGKLTIEDSKVEVDGAFASATSTFYPTTLTNSTITINGNQISGGLSDFSGGTSNQLGNVKINNSTLTIKEGTTKVAANVTATNSTIAVNDLTVNSGKTLNLNEGSTLEAENITTAGTGSVKIDGVQVPVVDGAIVVPVADFAALKAAVEAGKNVQFTADITTSAAITTSGVTSVVDLNGKTLTIGAGDNQFNDESNITIKNGDINITGVTVGGNAIFRLDEYEKTLVTTMTLENVNLVGNGYSSAYGIFYIGSSSVLNVIGGEWNLKNDTYTDGGVFKADASAATLNIEGTKITAHNVRRFVTYAATEINNATIALSGDADEVDAEMEHGFNRSPLAISNSTITMTDMVGRGITAEKGAVTIANSSVTMTNVQEATIDVRGNQTVTIDSESTVTLDKEPTVTSGTITGNVIVDASVGKVAKIGDTYYKTLQEAIDACEGENNLITLLNDITFESDLNNAGKGYFNIADGKKVVLDMNGKTINVTDKSTGNFIFFYNYGEFTVANGTINLTSTNNREWNAESAIFLNRGGIFNIENGIYTHNGGTDMAFVVDNSGNYYGDATTNIYERTLQRNTVETTLTSSYIAIRNRMEQNTHGASGEAILNVYGGTISGTSRAIWAQAASTSETAPATGEINVKGGNIGLIDTPRSTGAVSMTTISGGEVSAFKGEAGELTVTGGTLNEVTLLTAAGEAVNDYAVNKDGLYVQAVAKIGETSYETLQAAVDAVQNGQTITLLADAAEDVTIPAGVTFNGNGKAVGNITAAGTITFNGHTKATSFNVENTNTTINIVEGACLEITGSSRMVIGHGCTFNITGSIEDAKTADKAALTPSLIMPGASFTGAGVTFNVTNAYIKTTASYCSSSKSASSTFDFDIENSIWEQFGKLAFESQSVNATVNFDLVNSVLTTTSHLVFGVSRGEVVIDNSNVNVGTSRQIENQSTMTVKNGSVVNGAVATSSNAINPGTIIVENATYAVTGEFSGAAVGTGKLIIKKGANVSVGSIKAGANVVVDAEGMAAGDEINFTADLSQFTGTLSVINNDNLEAKIVDGKIVLVVKPVAKIGDVEYTTLEDAFKAATSGSVIEFLSDVTVDYDWDCRNTGSKFTVPVTINGNDKTIKFTGAIDDKNWNTVFRFEEEATVNNLTVNIEGATTVQRVITAKKSLNVDDLTIVGNSRYGIIFGEGASAEDLAATEIVIKNSALNGTRRAVSDNEGGKDVKSVVIEGNNLTANVYVSASESIVFKNNTTTSEVDLRSYAADNVLSVEAKDNELNEEVKNYIYAKNIDAQEEFTTENPPLKVSTKAELNAAINAANDGDVIEMTADIDYGTEQLKIEKPITLDLGGKTLNAFGGMSIKNNPTIKNGNIVHASNTAAIKVWNATAFEDLVIDVQGKGDANKTIGGIVLQSGSTTRVGSIKNVTIKGDALTNGIETYNCGDATENVIGSMENVNIDAVGTAMLISAPCGTATNCTFDGGVNGIEIWIKGNYSASLELDDCYVVGGVFAHDEFSSNPEIVNNGTLNLTADVATEGAGVDDVTLTLARVEAENVEGVLVVVMEQAKAKVNNTYYQTLEAAVNAAKDGEEIDLLKDVKLTSTLLLTKNNILDGNGFKLTPAEGGFTPDGNAAVIVLAANMSGYEANRTYTVKNLTIEGFSTPSRIVRANFCDATIQNCIFDDNASASIITSAYAVLNVEDNTFTNNTASFAVINVGSDVSDGTNLVAKIIDNTFENNEAAIAGIFLASSADVTGNHFKDNTHTGDNANAAAILAGPYTGNMAYTVNINSNAFENAMSKDGTALPSVFAEDWSSLGSTTSFDLSLNYWDGNEPEAGTAYKTCGDNPQVTVKSYYKTYEGEPKTLGGLVEYPQGNDFTGYTRGDAIWGEVWGNARESFVIKVLDANGNVMGTTSLNNVNGIIDGDVNVTWNIKLDAASNTDEYWTMAWTTAPTIDNMPAKVELWVDGVKVSGGNVVLNGPDEIAKIYAAVTDASGKILGYHTDIQEAIKAAAAVTSVARTATAGTVEVLSDVTVDKWVMFAEKMNIGDGSLITLNINGVTIDGNGKTLTVKSIESAGNGNRLFYDAQNLTVKDLTINIADGLVGGIGLQSGTISNVTFNGGQYGVLPGKNGVTVSGCTFNDTKSYAVYYEDERPGIVVTGNTFNTADGAYAITMRSDEQFTNNTITKGRVNLANSAASTVSGNDFGNERFKVYNGATATISNNKINNLVFNETNAPAASTFAADNTLSAEAQAAIDALPVMAGDGTEANPYTIGNLAQLKAFRDDVNAGNKYQGKFVKLTADIDLNNEEWTPIATFNGKFDGNDKTISNLVVNGEGKSNQGFFGQTNNGEIKNLTINNAKVTGRLNVGVVAGTPYTSKYTNIKVTGHVEVNGMAYVGGVGGKNAYANWTDITVSVDETSYVNAYSVENGTAYRTYVGGVIGFNGEGSHTFKNISSNIKVIGSTKDVGGIFGILHYGNNAENVTFTGAVEAPADAKEVGGIAGVWHNEKGQTVTIKNAKSEGTVKVGDVSTTGSIVGGAYNADNKYEANSGSLIIDGKEAWLPCKVATKAELDAAIAAAEKGDIIVMDADIDYGTAQLAITKEITLDLGGKTLTTRNAWGGMSIKNNPTVKNGTIVHASNTAAIKVWNATAFEDLVIDVQGKGDANKTIGGIVLQSGSTTCVGSIKNVTIKGAALTNGIETYNCGDATENVIGAMENVNIDAVGTAMLISAPCGTATNCTFDGGVNGIEIWIKGNYSASLELDDCYVVGGVFAHDEFSSNPEIVNNGTLNLTADEATTGAGVDDVTLTLARAENVEGVLEDVMEQAKAKVNNTYYQTLQAAINAVQNGETITLLSDITENVTLTEKVGLYYTINGSDKTMNGKITVNTLSDTNDNRRITISNINFVEETDANVDFISAVNTNHYPRLTISGCDFTGSGNDGDVAIRLKSSHSVVIENCTGTGLHSFLQNTSGWNLTINNVTVTESKGGLALGTVQGVTIAECEVTTDTYGIRLDADTYNNNAVIESCTVNAFIPVVVRKVNAASSITFNGTNTMTQTNTDGLWCAIGTSEYETNGTMPTAPTGQVTVTLNDTGLNAEGIYGNYAPIKLQDANNKVVAFHTNFEAALAAAIADENVVRMEISEDITQTTVEDSDNYYDVVRPLSIGTDGAEVTVSIKPTSGGAISVRVMGDGASLIIEENLTIDHLDVVANGFATTGESMVINGTLKAVSLKQWTNNNTITVSETGSVWLGFGDGQFDMAYGNGTVTINGNGNETEPQFKAGYSGTRGNGNTLNLNDTYFEGGAWFNVNGSNGVFNIDNSVLKVSGGDGAGSLTVASSGNKFNLTNGAKLDVATLTLGTGNNITIDGTSQVVVTTLSGEGTINIDATNLTEDSKPIVGNASDFAGEIKVINNDDLKVIIDENGNVSIVEKVYVAQIGEDNKFETLQDAIDAANATDVINVVSSTTENITIADNDNITLTFSEGVTLNGYFAPFKGNLTIKDGTINNTNSGASAIEINSGKLNLENVNISSARHAVRIDGAITATINGGEYTLTATSGTRHAVNVSGGAEVTITAGTFVGPKGTTMDSGSAVCVQAGAKVTIEGGDFSGGKNATLGVTGTMIVTGGTFDQDPSAYLAQGYITKYNETTSRYEVFKGVAKIEDEYFASIQDAIDAAENDDVIKVLNYIYLSDDKELNTLDGKYNTYFKVEDKTVTIDLNGKIIYVEYSNPNMLVGVFSTENNGHLTLMDSSNGTGSVDVVTKGNGVVYSLIANYESGCSITINGGTYKLDKASDSHIYSGCGCTNEGTQGVTVNGGVFYLGNVATGSNGSPWIFNVKGQNNGHVKVFGGTYNYNVFNQHWIFEAQTSKEYAIRYDGDETWTVVPAVAWVNNQKQSGGNWYTYELGYATLAEAIAAAEDCNRPDFAETVTLLQDITLENTITVNAGRDVILDLKGKTISGVCNSGQGHMFMVQNTADLTVKDSSENEEGKITYSRGTSNTGWVIDLEGDLILESGTIELTGDSWSIGYAVDVRPNSWGSEYTEATTFTMKGGKLVSSDAAVRVASSSADNHENVSANFIMNGGEIEAAWDGIFVQQSNAAYDILNVRINGGNIKSALSPLRLYGPAATSVLNNVENPITLNITGGTFDYTGNDLGNEKWLVRGVIMVSGGATFEQMLGYTDFEITGGTFEGDVNAYCAEGFAATNNDNGTWTVMPAQEQSLVKGWNWYSTYLDIETADLTGALGSNGVQIKNQDGGKTFYVSQREVWEGSLTLEHDKMYMINVLEACSLQLAADVVDATSYDIELRKGWSWIGYPSNQEIDINTALANFTEPNEGDRIKSQYNGYAEYRWGKWRGTLKTLVPGIGYMYNNKTETVKSFSYNFTPVTTSRGAVEANVTAENNYWTPNATKYPFNMTMTAVVDGLADANYEVAAFVNGEVRGSARPIYIEEIDAYVLFLTIHGEDVEEMSFRLYDIDNNTEYDLSDRINYSNNAEVGSLDNPYTFSRGTTGIGEASMSEVNIYPNPTTTGTEINLEATCDKVEVFNALGVKVAEYQNVDTIDALETAGIYVIRITNNGNVQNCRLVVK